MRFAWPLYLAWKQLFPSQKRISFFSLLSVIGVALGVNVMIVVIAFMQGFQQKFRTDIISSQGHARAVPLNPSPIWPQISKGLLERDERTWSDPLSAGTIVAPKSILPFDSILHGLGSRRCRSGDPTERIPDQRTIDAGGYDSQDLTPIPTMDDLEDEVVFITRQVANRLGVRPATIIRLKDANATEQIKEGKGEVRVRRLDPFVPSGQWTVTFLDEKSYRIEDQQAVSKGGPSRRATSGLGLGFPVFEALPGGKPFEKGDQKCVQSFRSSILEVYSPSMIEKAKADELAPHELGWEESFEFLGKVFIRSSDRYDAFHG